MHRLSTTRSACSAHRREPFSLLRNIRQHPQFYWMVLPAVAYLFLFDIMPMFGLQIAFKNYRISRSIWNSPWVGLDHFRQFFRAYQFGMLMRNTLGMNLLKLALGFPLPVLLSLLLNHIPNLRYKKIIQTVTYAPYFISSIVLASIMNLMLAPSTGVINTIMRTFGKAPVYFLGRNDLFWMVYVCATIWKTMGYSIIIYLAALTGVDPQLYDAGVLDGASKLQIIRYIDWPSLIPTVVILLVMAVGGMMNTDMQFVYALQNPTNLQASEVISTYVYKIGIEQAQFSYSSAIGLFNNVINVVLLTLVNTISRRLTGAGLW